MEEVEEICPVRVRDDFIVHVDVHHNYMYIHV